MTPRPIDHAQVARTEAGKRPVGLAEALGYAYGLDLDQDAGGVYAVLAEGHQTGAMADVQRIQQQMRDLEQQHQADMARLRASLEWAQSVVYANPKGDE